MAKVLRYAKDMAFSAKVNASVSLAEGTPVGLNSSGEAVKASKTQGAVVPCIGVAVAAADGALGAYVAIAPVAVVGGLSSLTIGARQYLGADGAFTATRPTTANDLIQPLGHAIAADKIMVVAAAATAVAQAAGTTVLA